MYRATKGVEQMTAISGKWHKLGPKIGMASLGAAFLAVPLAVALAQGPEFAATEEAAAAAEPALTAEQVAQGRSLFNSWSCGACHALSDANGFGQIGPALDGNATLDKVFVANRITNGQGAMPGFGGQLSPEEIDLIAAYVVAVKK
jgi:mono/diheme cytochrome c family protein